MEKNRGIQTTNFYVLRRNTPVMTTHIIIQLNDIVLNKLKPILCMHDHLFILSDITTKRQRIVLETLNAQDIRDIYWVTEQTATHKKTISKKGNVIDYAEFISKIQNQSAIKSWY